MIAQAVILAVAASAAAAPQVTAHIGADTVTLGDRFQLTLTVVHPSDMAVNLPASLELGTEFAELGRATQTTDNGDGSVSDRFMLDLAAYDVGDLEIPAIPITYVADGAAHTLETDPIQLTVDSYVGPNDATELKPIAGPVEVDRRDWTMAYVGGGIVGVALLFALGMLAARLLRRRQSAHEVGSVGEARRAPPHEEALARLQRLEASGALDADDLKPAYFEMGEILRDYLGRRFGFPGIDYTTEEVNAAMAARSEAQVIAADVSTWLADADFVKFADYPASHDEARSALYKARQLVHESMPAAQAEEARRGAG